MAEDQVDSEVENSEESQESERSFGEVAERDDGEEVEGKLVSDKLKEIEASEDEGETESKEETEEKTESKETKLTEKGTKLDEDPLTAAHQLLANEKRVRGQMEQVLGNPELLSRFVKDRYGIDLPVKGQNQSQVEDLEQSGSKEPVFKEYKPEDFENLDDVAKVMNEIQKNFATQLENYKNPVGLLTKAVGSLVESGRNEEISSNIVNQIKNLQTIPELDPKSPDYIEGLEEDIAQQFNDLDLDPNTQMYRGRYSISKVAEKLIEAARKGKKSGSLKTQTIVKDKTSGKARVSEETTDEEDTSKLNPGDSIALGIAKMFGK